MRCVILPATESWGLMASKATLISGAPAVIRGVVVRQPTLHEIMRVVGHDAYSSYLYVFGITVEQFMEHMERAGEEQGGRSGEQAKRIVAAYRSLTDEQRAEIHRFDLLVAEPSWRGILLDALSFFISGELDFNLQTGGIYVVTNGTRITLDGELFDLIRDFVFQAARLKNEEAKPAGFVNAAAKAAYERLQAIKAEQAQQKKASGKEPKVDPDTELWNLVGAVASRSNSYNLLNIFELTVYQLYDQFERINKQEYLDGYASKWAAWGKDSYDFGGWYKISSDK